ncbi:MAG: F0F1 ATP synthase subunit A [Candidatus Azobacteroides sp.]|nr:F0F1 ATP synthase subunit A [Candidatus Azobacteroides sp.]
MKSFFKIGISVFTFLLAATNVQCVFAENRPAEKEGELNIREFIMEHLSDSYEWHVTNFGEHVVSVPLPVIVKGKDSGWQIFLSSAFYHGETSYRGFYIAKDGEYKGKIVEKDAGGKEVRPFDISITKTVFALILSSVLLICIILFVARWYKNSNQENAYKTPKGFVAFMELFIMNINDDVIKPCIGKDYKKYAPYLLTVFFFVFLNNIMGLIPVFPFGANVTGNIAVTSVLALCTFLAVNLFGSKEYWREIFWPDVPVWLKAPVPIMPVLEFVGIFTKPFALMIRLFANILAGHSITLGLTCLIFVTVKLGAVANTSMTITSVILSVFILLVEVLVIYIQAYVFTLLSAVFIGLSRVESPGR